MPQVAKFYTVELRSKFTATSGSKILIGEENWNVVETSSVVPGNLVTIAGFNAIVPASASTVVKIGRESTPEGFFFTSGSVAIGSAVTVVSNNNYLSIEIHDKIA